MHLRITSPQIFDFQNEVSKSIETIVEKATKLDVYLNIFVSFGKFVFFPKKSTDATNTSPLKQILPTHNTYNGLKNAFLNQIYSVEELKAQLMGLIDLTVIERRSQLTVFFKIEGETYENYILFQFVNGKYEPEFFCHGKNKIVFLNALNDPTRLDSRLQFRSFTSIQSKFPAYLDRLQIDPVLRTVTGVDKSLTILKYRFLQSEAFEASDPGLKFLINEIKSDEADLHHEFELEDKDLMDKFKSADYPEKDLYNRIQALQAFALKITSKLILPS
jgi:hypothetical protein